LGEALKQGKGEIEIRTFPRPSAQYFYSSVENAALKAIELCSQGKEVYFGVNPRTGRGGKKKDVEWVSALHAEIDYGKDGHKKDSPHADYDEALAAINRFEYEPTLIIHSGGGFHCYWVLRNAINVKEIGVEKIEGLNIILSALVGGDKGTQDISRVLRIPGTYNFKLPDTPRPVTLVANSGNTYELADFEDLVAPDVKPPNTLKEETTVSNAVVSNVNLSPIDIDRISVSERIKNLIRYGNDGTYASRSDADFAVILALTNCGRSENDIKQVFLTHKIGEKYRKHPSPDQYLKYSIEKAKKLSNLTPEERENPLFVSGSIYKTEQDYHLKPLRLEEYMVEKQKIKFLDKEKAFFRYNGKCFEELTEDKLNNACQKELGRYRETFTIDALKKFIHYAKGNAFIESEKAQEDQINYLTLMNGLYKMDEGIIIPHTSDIFTTNLLPYNYDPSAQCPRFIRFLDEVFMGETEKIDIVQEAVGYAFHKSMPTPSVFFLVGSGSNGKSVFINTIANLIGHENTSNISFNSLSDEYYILELFQKMLNISGETPVKNLKTDTFKSVTGGDWVTGRTLYKQPMKFRPFAKHFLAMNKRPVIQDTSHGMLRRIWIIDFPRTFTAKDMDRQLEQKLASELSGIFNWAMEGYKRLRELNFALRETESMRLQKQEYQNEMDSVRAFVHDRLIKSDNPDDRIKYSCLYEKYCQYCQSEKRKDPEEKSGFKKVLVDLHFKVESSKKDGNQVYVFNVKEANEGNI
jgi:putative DNA primase/helicase